jgi:GntR family transcriptional regulator
MSTEHQRIIPDYIPKYRQLLIILRDEILGGQIPPGTRIPSEEELVAAYGVSRGTVRNAIAQLEAEKLIETQHGVGSFVRAIHPNAMPFRFLKPDRFADDSKGERLYEVIAQERIPAPFDIAERLKLAPGSSVIHIARRRRVGGTAVSFSERYVHDAVLPSLVNEDLNAVESIHDLLVSASDYPLLKVEIEVEAHSMNDEEARLLDGEPGAPAIVVHRMTYTAPNRPAVWYYGLFKKQYDFSVGVV